MMFFKLLRYDCKVGILYSYKKPLTSLVLFTCICLDCFMKFHSYETLDTPFTVTNTLGNTLLYIFAGIQEYDPQTDTQFIFPAVWMLLYLTLAYFTLYYPYNDLEESGQNILLRSGGRRLWWTSKCCWNICTSVLFFLIGWTVIVAACLIQGIPLSMELSQNINILLGMRITSPLLYPTELTFEILALPMLVMISVNLMQMALSLFIRPIYSYIVTGALLLASTYYQSPFLIGNYAMPIRSSRMVEDGVNPIYGVLLSIAITVISYFVGLLYFKRYDILRKGNES